MSDGFKSLSQYFLEHSRFYIILSLYQNLFRSYLLSLISSFYVASVCAFLSQFMLSDRCRKNLTSVKVPLSYRFIPGTKLLISPDSIPDSISGFILVSILWSILVLHSGYISESFRVFITAIVTHSIPDSVLHFLAQFCF